MLHKIFTNFSLYNVSIEYNNLTFDYDDHLQKELLDFRNNYTAKRIELKNMFDNIYNECSDYNYLYNLFVNDGINYIDNYDEQYSMNDKIMVTKNKYELELMNGMIGNVTGFNRYKKEICIDFGLDKEPHIISKDDFDIIKLAYIITIHKSQGSEAPIVIILFDNSIRNTINLLYTAVTRAKNKCILISDTSIIEYIIKQNKRIRRKSKLNKLCFY